MKTPCLDLPLLQSLVALKLFGSLSQAADRIGRTQSALSLQMQRLEDTLGIALFDRSGRSLVFTDAGLTLVAYAERLLLLNNEAVASVRGLKVAGNVRFGMSVDFEHTWLPKAMADFARTHPNIRIDLRVDRNSVLERAIDRREVDIALVFAPEAPEEKAQLTKTPMLWIAAKDFQWNGKSELPLLMFENPCMFCQAATRSLDEAGVAWRVAVTSPSLGGIWAAAAAGLGVVVRTGVALPAGLAEVGGRFKLPALPQVGIRILETDRKANAARARLRAVLNDVLEHALPNTALVSTALVR
jgi:DNA-binding transcriptional LysR family regulator